MERRERRQRRQIQRSDVPLDFGFTDVANASGITFEHRPVADSVWNVMAGGPQFHYPGVATADVDGDGDQDLYFVNQAGPNQLWLNDGDGHFVDATAVAGVAMEDQMSTAASFADADGDGDQDLYVTTFDGRNRLFENTGGGRFEDRTETAGVGHRGHSSSSVWFDYDGDGDLDLLVVNLADFTISEEGPDGYPLTDERFNRFPASWTEGSVLYRNDGDLAFTAVRTALARPDAWDVGATLVPDRGEPPDVYLSQFSGPDALFDNRGDRFQDVTARRLDATPMGSFGAEVLDANGDGRFDIYVHDKHSDMFGSAGSRTLQEMGQDLSEDRVREFVDPYPERWRGEDLIFGSALFRRTRDGYRDVSDTVGAETHLPWGVSTGDVNADGRVDLFVTSGQEYSWYAPSALLLNERGAGFVRGEFATGIHPLSDRYHVWNRVSCDDVVGGCEALGVDGEEYDRVDVMNRRSARGSVVVDIDGDGDLDIVANEFHDGPRVLENDLMQRTNRSYIAIQLEAAEAAPGGIGSVVTVRTDRDVYHRFVDGTSYLAQNDRPIYVGLGPRETVRRVTVDWPSGSRSRHDVEARDTTVTLSEP